MGHGGGGATLNGRLNRTRAVAAVVPLKGRPPQHPGPGGRSRGVKGYWEDDLSHWGRLAEASEPRP